MSRKKKVSPTNITKERLAGTPFSSAAEMNAASEELRREAWSQLERAKIKRELLAKDEYKFFLEPFQKGMSCKYVKKDENLVKVSLAENGIEVDINEEMKTVENSGALLSALIRSTSDSLFSNYLRSMDIICDSESSSSNETERRKNTNKTTKSR
jgi:hypothetical protein